MRAKFSYSNAGLGRELSSPAAACMVLCVVAFFTITLVLIVTGPAAIFKIFDCSKHLLLGGVFFRFTFYLSLLSHHKLD